MTLRISANNLNAFMERLCREAPDYWKLWRGDVRTMTYPDFNRLLQLIYLPRDYSCDGDDFLFPLNAIPNEYIGFATLDPSEKITDEPEQGQSDAPEQTQANAKQSEAWRKGIQVSGYDPNEWRKDHFGDLIRWLEFDNRASQYGWEIVQVSTSKQTKEKDAITAAIDFAIALISFEWLSQPSPNNCPAKIDYPVHFRNSDSVRKGKLKVQLPP